MNPQAANLFRARYRGAPNVLTPVLVRHSMIACGALAVEVSRSADETQWGVTVLKAATPDEHSGLSKAFGSRDDAEAYIASLREYRA